MQHPPVWVCKGRRRKGVSRGVVPGSQGSTKDSAANVNTRLSVRPRNEASRKVRETEATHTEQPVKRISQAGSQEQGHWRRTPEWECQGQG